MEIGAIGNESFLQGVRPPSSSVTADQVRVADLAKTTNPQLSPRATPLEKSLSAGDLPSPAQGKLNQARSHCMSFAVRLCAREGDGILRDSHTIQRGATSKKTEHLALSVFT